MSARLTISTRQSHAPRCAAIVVSAGQAVVLLAAIAVAVVATDAGDWQPASLLVTLTVLLLAGQLLSPLTSIGRIGPAVSMTTLAMVLLGWRRPR